MILLLHMPKGIDGFFILFHLLPGTDPSSGVSTPLPGALPGHRVLRRQLSEDFLLGSTSLLNQATAVGFDLQVSFNKKGAKLGVVSQSQTVDSGIHLYFLVISTAHICKPYFRYTVYT